MNRKQEPLPDDDEIFSTEEEEEKPTQKKGNARVFSPALDERLRHMVAEGYSVSRISSELKITRERICKRVVQLKLREIKPTTDPAQLTARLNESLKGMVRVEVIDPTTGKGGLFVFRLPELAAATIAEYQEKRREFLRNRKPGKFKQENRRRKKDDK